MAAIIAQITRANRERIRKKRFEIIISKCMYEIKAFPEKYEPEVRAGLLEGVGITVGGGLLKGVGLLEGVGILDRAIILEIKGLLDRVIRLE